jgi:hypothetical protein
MPLSDTLEDLRSKAKANNLSPEGLWMLQELINMLAPAMNMLEQVKSTTDHLREMSLLNEDLPSKFNEVNQVLSTHSDAIEKMQLVSRDVCEVLSIMEEKSIDKQELAESIGIISDKLNALDTELRNHGTKLDGEDVTNLDIDYRQAIDSDLNI